MTSYCVASRGNPLHEAYHDTEYGFPLRDDAALFERLCLEISQAGLSWLIVLKRLDGYRRAFSGFDPATIAAYGDADVERLLADTGIIRNRKKIDAVIENARRIQALPEGSFVAWLDAHHPRDHAAWTRLFKQTFVFTGPEVVNEFLMSTGYLPGAHDAECPVYAEIAALNPAWMSAGSPTIEMPLGGQK